MTTREQLEVHHKEAWFWARQCCRFQPDLAEDVLQTAYLKVLEKRALFHGKSSFKTWLFSVIRFTAIDMATAQHLHVSKHLGIDGIQLSEVTNSQKEDDAMNYESMINQLPGRQAELLLLVFYHDMTVEKAAEVMETSIGTARTHYDRGKKRLRELILASQLKQAI
ncbi:MAG: RNA polymerase sigma factor [Imperialibacter sp.]|uniref:RNA polymerase sigma factor n=1 Tax=Imperialibacter sp. TaxID=2038411 RepID=UPI0032F09239